MKTGDPIPDLHLAIALKRALFAENNRRLKHSSAFIQGVLAGIRLGQTYPITATAIEIAIRDWTPQAIEQARATARDIDRSAHARRRQRQ